MWWIKDSFIEDSYTDLNLVFIDVNDIPEEFYDPIHVDLGTTDEETEELLLAEETTQATNGDGEGTRKMETEEVVALVHKEEKASKVMKNASNIKGN